jgi:hypothetical protein
MANEYDRIIEEMMAKCEVLRAGQSRQECCKEKGITDCPPLPQSSHVEQNAIPPLYIAFVAILVTVALVYFAHRKRWLRRSIESLSEATKATVGAWVIWILVVSSYVVLFSPYGADIDNDEVLNLILWFVLPPLSALAIYRWAKRFGSAKK